MSETGIQLRLGDILYAFIKRWKLIVLLTAAGMVFGLLMTGASSLQNIRRGYEVKSSFALVSKTESGTYTGGALMPSQQDYHLAEDMVSAAIYIMKSDRALEEVIDSLALLGTTPNDIRRNLTLSQYGATQIIELNLVWNDPDEGVRIAEGIMSSAQTLLPEIVSIGSVAVINYPETEFVSGTGVDKKLPLVVMALGFLVAAAIAIGEILLHPTLINVRDVNSLFRLELIGTIPENEEYFSQPLMKAGSAQKYSHVTQDFSAAAHILINRIGTKSKSSIIYVTSSNEDEGKSAVTANLALQLSEIEKKVLLVDLDTRRPSIGGIFLENVDYSRSLNALYQGDSTKEEAIISITGYLDILPTVLGYNAVPSDNAVLDLIRELSRQYDYVLIDAAPVGQVSDVLTLNQLSNACLFVVKYDSTGVQEIRNSIDKLNKSGISILGCIVNGVTKQQGIFGDVTSYSGLYGGERASRSDDNEGTAAYSDLDSLVRKRVDGTLTETGRKKGNKNKIKEEKEEKPEETKKRRLFAKRDKEVIKAADPERDTLSDLLSDEEEGEEPDTIHIS